jgi:hypothetical protein
MPQMDVWSRDQRGPKEEKKKVELRQMEVKKPPGVHQSGRLREISVFPLTKLIMDVPRILGISEPLALARLMLVML